MNADEIVPRHQNGNGSFKMREFFAKAVCKSCESAQMHPYSQIGALDMTRANVRQVGVSTDWGWDCFDDLGRSIPIRSSVVGFPVQFDELGKVYVRTKTFLYGPDVRLECVGRDLHSPSQSMAEVSDEIQGAGAIAPRHQVGNHELAFSVQPNPSVGISPFFGVSSFKVSLLCMHQRPKLVQLNVFGLDPAHPRIKNTAALLTDRQKQRQDCSLVGIREPGDSADTHTLDHQRNDLGGTFKA